MLEINLLKNNIPKTIDIPKKKGRVVKFFAIFIGIILAVSVAIFMGMYLATKVSRTQLAEIDKHQKMSNVEKLKKIAKNEKNSSFSVSIVLQNATSSADMHNSTSASELTQSYTQNNTKSITKSDEKKEFGLVKNIQKPLSQTPIVKKQCSVICDDYNLGYLKDDLTKRHIEYTINEITNANNNYLILVGGLSEPDFEVFKKALIAKGYRVKGTKILHGKYYANLGAMNEVDKNKFLSVWSNLGFDIVVDKQKEMDKKRYEVRFWCTKDIISELKGRGFNVKSGRSAAW